MLLNAGSNRRNSREQKESEPSHDLVLAPVDVLIAEAVELRDRKPDRGAIV